MSTDADSADFTEQALRDHVDQVVVSRSQKGRVMHVPDDESDDPMPLCGTADRNRGWVEKDAACYPPGYRDLCQRCIEQFQDRDDTDEPRGPTEPSWTVRQWTDQFSHALDSDW